MNPKQLHQLNVIEDNMDLSRERLSQNLFCCESPAATADGQLHSHRDTQLKVPPRSLLCLPQSKHAAY